jgi:glutaconate CoA-transferase subunit B
MFELFSFYLQGGLIDVGFLGAAQIDRFGNINTTVIGDYAHPKVRLPGSGGATEIAAHARRTLIVAKLGPRTFPEQVDFVTSPGHRYRGTPRAEFRMPGQGPVTVITDKGVLEADRKSGELVLAALYPGVSAAEVRAGVGWQLAARTTLREIAPPTARELQLLREVLDPNRLYLKG